MSFEQLQKMTYVGGLDSRDGRYPEFIQWPYREGQMWPASRGYVKSFEGAGEKFDTYLVEQMVNFLQNGHICHASDNKPFFSETRGNLSLGVQPTRQNIEAAVASTGATVLLLNPATAVDLKDLCVKHVLRLACVPTTTWYLLKDGALCCAVDAEKHYYATALGLPEKAFRFDF